MAEEQKRIELEVPVELEDGAYANLVMVANSSSEVVLDFFRMMPGRQKPKLASRVIMAPEHAKRLALTLSDTIRKYEAQFGKIELNHGKGGATATPFGTPQGEA